MPELRKDPIVGRWVIIATERGERPIDFTTVQNTRRGGFCPFCNGYEGKTPPEITALRPGRSAPDTPGWTTRVVPNKFPALRIEGRMDRWGAGIYDFMEGVGAHEVIIETPDHEGNMAGYPPEKIEEILWVYRERILDLQKDKRFRYILVFKNKGEAAGASLEHPHSQLIALPIVPINVQEELAGVEDHFRHKERCIFCDIIRHELREKVRIVGENDRFVTICPIAPRFPFECWILPKEHSASYVECEKPQLRSLAESLLDLMKRLDKLLKGPPYNYLIHTAPTVNQKPAHYHWHIEVMPKLSRTAGFEWGTGFYINPMPPEKAAAHLREVEID